jgi:hypothetical protein
LEELLRDIDGVHAELGSRSAACLSESELAKIGCLPVLAAVAPVDAQLTQAVDEELKDVNRHRRPRRDEPEGPGVRLRVDDLDFAHDVTKPAWRPGSERMKAVRLIVGVVGLTWRSALASGAR